MKIKPDIFFYARVIALAVAGAVLLFCTYAYGYHMDFSGGLSSPIDIEIHIPNPAQEILRLERSYNDAYYDGRIYEMTVIGREINAILRSMEGESNGNSTGECRAEDPRDTYKGDK